MKIGPSVLANLAATLVLALLMVLKSMMGLLPALNVISMLSRMMHGPMVAGWAAHLIIGTIVYGIGFAVLYRYLPGKTSVVKGISFALLAWLLMMVAIMPMAGAGIFGINIGIMAAVMTLVLHILYGIIVGLVFDKLAGAPETAPAHG